MTSTVQEREHLPNPEQILQIGLGFWASKTLLSAVELGKAAEPEVKAEAPAAPKPAQLLSIGPRPS